MSFLRHSEHYCIGRHIAEGILGQLGAMVSEPHFDWCDDHNAYTRVAATIQGGSDQMPATLVLVPSEEDADAINVIVQFRDAFGNILAGEDADLCDVEPDVAPQMIFEQYRQLAVHAASWGAGHPRRRVEL